MDKFGLFDLLSAFLPEQDAQPAQQKDPAPSQPEQRPTERAHPLGDDARASAFRLTYAENLLERHDAISRRIDRKHPR